jgi:hypothetical protein
MACTSKHSAIQRTCKTSLSHYQYYYSGNSINLYVLCIQENLEDWLTWMTLFGDMFNDNVHYLTSIQHIDEEKR